MSYTASFRRLAPKLARQSVLHTLCSNPVNEVNLLTQHSTEKIQLGFVLNLLVHYTLVVPHLPASISLGVFLSHKGLPVSGKLRLEWVKGAVTPMSSPSLTHLQEVWCPPTCLRSSTRQCPGYPAAPSPGDLGAGSQTHEVQFSVDSVMLSSTSRLAERLAKP